MKLKQTRKVIHSGFISLKEPLSQQPYIANLSPISYKQ